MFYRILADLLVVFHFAFIVFVMLGGVLALRWRWMMWIHLPVAAWGAFIEFSGRICPLTPLENVFRRKAGLADYTDSFVEHYVLPVIYPAELTRELQLLLGVIVLAVNLAIYAYVIWRYRRVR